MHKRRSIMNIILAFDSFKESMSSLQAAQSFKKGFSRIIRGTRYQIISISDGGEGFVQSMVLSAQGRSFRIQARDPLMKKIRAPYGLVKNNRVGVVEMAAASGLHLVPPSKRNPLNTTTYGTGQLIAAALRRNPGEIIVGIGGSATTDCGLGMAQALGARIYDRKGRLFKPGMCGRDMINVGRIDATALKKRIGKTRFRVACDVTNPLYGKKGAAHIYGPQKGATPKIVKQLDLGLRHMARIIKRDLKKKVDTLPGSGAAGGLGAGLTAFLNAKLEKGIDIVLDVARFDDKCRKCDLVITGEGKIDGQSIFGKAPVGIAQKAKKLKKPAMAVCGALGPGTARLKRYGLKECIAITPPGTPLARALKQGKKNMQRTASDIALRIKKIKP
jgi:glycerate kinase